MMLEFLPSLGSLLSYGSVSAFSKKAITAIGRHKAITYAYAALVSLLFIGALALGASFLFPVDLLPAYIAQVAIGGLGSIAMFKALDHGKASLIGPLNKTYVILILATGIIFLGEELTTGQIAGSLIIVLAASILTINRGQLKPERWMLYLGLAILCRTYYYTFIKTFVIEFGPYMATLFLELGVALFVVGFHFLRGRDLSPPPISCIGLPLASGVLIFSGSLLYSISVGMIGAALTAAISAGTPIVNSVASYLLLGEKLDTRKYAAIVLMALGFLAIFLL